MFQGNQPVSLHFESIRQIQVYFGKLRSQQFRLPEGIQRFAESALLLTHQGTLHPQLRHRGITSEPFHQRCPSLLPLA